MINRRQRVGERRVGGQRQLLRPVANPELAVHLSSAVGGVVDALAGFKGKRCGSIFVEVGKTIFAGGFKRLEFEELISSRPGTLGRGRARVCVCVGRELSQGSRLVWGSLLVWSL